MPSRDKQHQGLRDIEDAAFTLAGVKGRLDPVERWLNQHLLINGADQQLINLLDAVRQLEAVRQRLLDELEQQRQDAAER